MTDLAEYTLADGFGAESGRVSLTGVQALVRAVLDQVRADARAGRQTAALVAGYRGSPLGGVDSAYARNRDLLQRHRVEFLNGVNEELGATMVWGSQRASDNPRALHDGVIGLWYGKGPGLDRAGDAIRHGTMSGVKPTDGVLAAVGDDPASKSSTLPSASEHSLADLALPTLYPANPQEVLDLGRYGYELSRACGSWVGFKIHTDVADGSGTVDVDPDRLEIGAVPFLVDGEPWSATIETSLVAPWSLAVEHEAFGVRLDAARHFAASNGLDRTVGTGDAWLGVLAAGKPYLDVRSALAQLGLVTDSDLEEVGIRLHKPALIWPLEPHALGRFARGLDTLMVVEEKRSFLETQTRDLLYGRTDAPSVVGKRDLDGDPLVPSFGALEPDQLVEPLRRLLAARIPSERLKPRRERIPVSEGPKLPGRTPYFCSGCPHNRSTVVPDGSVAGGGIGCHGMALFMPGRAEGITHMGGEGAQWVGMAPFVDEEHRFQNLGDGTLAHSGILAIRQAVATGTNITYKILYNGVVAMTGGQEAAGELPVPDLTRQLEAEGVARVVVVTDDPEKYPTDARFAPGTRILERDELNDVQLELRDVPGTTVIVYDQACAAELRRGRKRGRIDTPTTRVFINESVCDGCGHCGQISNCISVHPVQTEFGRKTRIHQESCNFDLTCVGGECPAFITVEIDPDEEPERTAAPDRSLLDLPMPADPVVPGSASVLTVGIGGTGVVTVNQLLTTAALLDDKPASSLDQTGLAQKGGPVVSHLSIGSGAGSGASRLSEGGADAYLVFDLVAGTSPQNLARADAERTTAVVSTSKVPTGQMVTMKELERFPDEDAFHERIGSVTRSDTSVWLDAEGVARTLFRSQPAANLVVVGVAYQLGLLPLSGEAIERAIELNGVSVEMNTDAFRIGRRLADDPSLIGAIVSDTVASPAAPELTGAAAGLAALVPTDDRLAETLAWRLPELIAFQNEAWARRYADGVGRIRSAETAVVDRSDLSDVVARQLFKLMTYKDEYEVARLHRRPELTEEIKRRFGHNARISFQLKPPILTRFGVDRKVAIPERAARSMFASLAPMKRLRGRRADPFGRTEERRVERALIDEYEALIERIASGLTVDGYDEAVELAGLADMIRGFGDIKLANVDRYRGELESALTEWEGR
jgi:indolepyruvate ferredoxin oxidoreductase